MKLFTKKSNEIIKRGPHHYIFAHVALRQVCLTNPIGFFALMASPNRQKFLNDLWEQICQNCDQEGNAQFSPKDIKIETFTIGEYPAVIVQMPTPQKITEAYMLCIVLKVPLSELKQEMDNIQIRYFTLEKGINVLGEDQTFLCAWDGEMHVNYGDGPEPKLSAFIDAIKKLI